MEDKLFKRLGSNTDGGDKNNNNEKKKENRAKENVGFLM